MQVVAEQGHPGPPPTELHAGAIVRHLRYAPLACPSAPPVSFASSRFRMISVATVRAVR